MSYAKPQLKGLFMSRLKFQIPGVLALSCLASAGIYFYAYRFHKNAYEEFYKTYDADEDYLRMKKLGIFKSIPCEGPLSPPDAVEYPTPAIDTKSYLEDISAFVRKYKVEEKKRIEGEKAASS
ncbi:COX6C [Lepeophtheirus salmonis]|uniref:COX6C n=1 Tax=Lepeophtheirus salmonis TaxID=72036 RepID=A0A0K2U0Q5_LEPSM|nr:COX6C [Lepeophtheirus salmonis]CAF2753010.1 COX6C [Lepeophtheirus salmonis]